jgi:simple sugar transport system substrate-binding protein
VIASRPDAIAVTIPNDLSFSKSLHRAKSLHIPVVAVNSKPTLEDRSKNPYLAFVGMDDYQAGRKVAERALSSGKLGEHVVIINHQPGLSGLENRQKGIRDVLLAKNIRVDTLDISMDPASITTIIESHLNRYPDIKSVFCLGPQGVHGIGHHFYKKKRDLYITSFDLSTFTLQLIREGIVAFSIDQQPFAQGYKSVSELLQLLRQKHPPQNIDTGVFFVNKENADTVLELVKKGLR